MATHLLLPDFPQIADKTGWPWQGPANRFLDEKGRQESWPKISVITTSLNQIHLLEETIRSVLLQGYPNLEYIIIDGGSTDGSIDLIKSYDSWITYWESEPNKGESHAFIKGFQKATGDIIAWLSCGDLYAPDSLRIVAQRLSNKSMGILVGATVITESAETLNGQIVSQWPSWEKMICEGVAFPQASVFWTRDLWKQFVPLDQDLSAALDYYLSIRLFPQVKTFIPEAMILSYMRPSDQAGGEERRILEVAAAAVTAAKQRSEPLLVWLAKMWFYRLRFAFWRRKLSLVKGTMFHQTVTKLILFPRRSDRSCRHENGLFTSVCKVDIISGS
jgi:glycosyltransferase involved in cell wall biosynthesis